MKKMFGLLAMFLLMGMLCGVAMASTDTGPPGVIASMFNMDDILADETRGQVTKRNEWPEEPDGAIGLAEKKGAAPAIPAGCNHKNHPDAGHLGGVSLARCNTMASLTTYLDMKLELPGRTFNPLT